MLPIPRSSSNESIISRHRNIFIIVLAVFSVIAIVVFGALQLSKLKVSVDPSTNSGLLEKKIEFGTDLPTGFPQGIPLDAGVTLSQSYSLDYPDQEQLTAVFSSQKTTQKNFDIYKDFFRNNGWGIMNVYESESVMSIYALKGRYEINVTISTVPTERSEVSISVLEK